MLFLLAMAVLLLTLADLALDHYTEDRPVRDRLETLAAGITVGWMLGVGPAYAQTIPDDPTAEPVPPEPGDHDCPTGIVVSGTPITADCDGLLVSPGDGWLLLDGWPVQYGRLRREHDGLTRELEQLRRELDRAEAARVEDRRRARETTAYIVGGIAVGGLTAIAMAWATSEVTQ